MTKVQEWTFTVLHVLGTLSLLILFSLLTGCFSDDDLKPGAKQTVSVADIQQQILTNAPAPDSLKKGDSVWIGHFGRVFTNPYILLQQNTYDVLDSKDFTEPTDTDHAEYTMFTIKHGNYDEHGNPVQVREGDCRLIRYLDGPLVGWYPECVLELPPFQDQLYILYPAVNAQPAQNPLRIFSEMSTRASISSTLFYNLSVISKKLSLPTKMVTENNCHGFTNCQVDGLEMQFDSDTTSPGKPISTQHFTLTFSKQLPYMASNLETCIRYTTISSIEEQCFRVLEF